MIPMTPFVWWIVLVLGVCTAPIKALIEYVPPCCAATSLGTLSAFTFEDWYPTVELPVMASVEVHTPELLYWNWPADPQIPPELPPSNRQAYPPVPFEQR